MARTSHKLINYHGSGELTNSDNLNLGEIAVKHSNDEPSLFIKKDSGELAQFVDKEYVDKSDINTITLIVDDAKNAGTYNPSWAGGGSSSEDNVQNGFVVVPVSGTNMDDWYASENRRVVLDIQDDAKAAIFGEYYAQELSSLLPCELSRIDDGDAGPTLIFEYRVKLDYSDIEGYLVIDQYDKGQDEYAYSYNLNPYSVSPIRVTATLSDGTYSCTVDQDYNYVLKYLNSGKKLIEFKKIDGSVTQYAILDGIILNGALPEGYESGMPYEIDGVYATIPNIENGVVGNDILIIKLTKAHKTKIGNTEINIPATVTCGILRSYITPSDFVKTVNNIAPDNKGNVTIPTGGVVAKLSVDLAENASAYTPYPYNMTDDDVIQNGFIVIPEVLNLDEWYASDSKSVILDVKEAAREKIFGTNLGEDVSGLIPCNTFRMEDTSAGPTYIFSYDFNFSYISVNGFISIDQWDYEVSGETKYSYSFVLNPCSNDPVEILAIEQEDGTYECQVTQSSGYCETYVENGGRNILLTTRPVKGADSSPLLIRCESSCIINGDMALLVGTIPNIGGGFKDSLIMLTKTGTAGYVQREAALKSDLDLKQNVLTAGNNIQISGDTISTINGGVILLDVDNIIGNSSYWDGDFDETITSGTTSGETEFFEFIGEDSASTITADEYFERLINSCVYVSTKMDGEVNFKLEVNNMYNDGNGLLTLVLHSHILGEDLEALDIIILLNFTQKVAYIQTRQWMSDDMMAAKPVLVEVHFSTEENASGETINTFTLKRDGEKILPSKIFDLERDGYRIQYFSYTNSNERRIMPLYRAEASNISSRINLFYVDTDSYHSSDYTPSLTFMNFTSAGTITYNETKGVYIAGMIEQIKFPMGIINSDNYLLTKQTLANKYEVNANVVEIDDAIEANKYPSYATILVDSNGTETGYDNVFCLGASSAFHGGEEYYYFTIEGVGNIPVKTEDIRVAGSYALNKNIQVQVYEWDSTNRVMLPVSGETLLVQSYVYADATVALADVLDVKKHLNDKQDVLTAGAGITISDDNVISSSSSVSSKYLFPMKIITFPKVVRTETEGYVSFDYNQTTRTDTQTYSALSLIVPGFNWEVYGEELDAQIKEYFIDSKIAFKLNNTTTVEINKLSTTMTSEAEGDVYYSYKIITIDAICEHVKLNDTDNSFKYLITLELKTPYNQASGTYRGVHLVMTEYKSTPEEAIAEITYDNKYIKYYATRAEYDADTTRQTPNVCYIEETDELIYNN